MGVELSWHQNDKQVPTAFTPGTCTIASNGAYDNDRWDLYSIVLMGRRADCDGVEIKLVIG